LITLLTFVGPGFWTFYQV